MAKRFIISEEERNDIRSRYGLLNEQQETPEQKKGLQCFLNKKGIRDDSNQPLKVDGNIGDKTMEAITKYQSKIGVYPTDGTWGPATSSKMPSKDVELFKQCIADEGSIIDKGLHMFGLD
jgi:peptidoglycan hydrolase-like protein with peptidoglycan-binding domain